MILAPTSSVHIKLLPGPHGRMSFLSSNSQMMYSLSQTAHPPNSIHISLSNTDFDFPTSSHLRAQIPQKSHRHALASCRPSEHSPRPPQYFLCCRDLYLPWRVYLLFPPYVSLFLVPAKRVFMALEKMKCRKSSI